MPDRAKFRQLNLRQKFKELADAQSGRATTPDRARNQNWEDKKSPDRARNELKFWRTYGQTLDGVGHPRPIGPATELAVP